MKRYLLLFCTVVLIGALIAVPAFATSADTSYSIELYEGHGSMNVLLPVGTYRVSVIVDGVSKPLQNDILEVSGDYTPVYLYFSDGSGDMLNIHYNRSASTTSAYVVDENDAIVEVVGFVRIDDSSVPDPEPDLGSGDPLSDVFGVFSPIGVWIGSSFGPLIGIFWNGSGLTFIGVLSVAALAFAVIFLLFVIVVRFLKFSG